MMVMMLRVGQAVWQPTWPRMVMTMMVMVEKHRVKACGR
jgi:hypothetical protein